MHFKSASIFFLVCPLNLHVQPLPTSLWGCIQEQLRKWLFPFLLHCLSLHLPETNIRFVCSVCGVVCMTTLLHGRATPSSLPPSLVPFSFSHPRLAPIFVPHVFSISPPSTSQSRSPPPPALSANPLASSTSSPTAAVT